MSVQTLICALALTLPFRAAAETAPAPAADLPLDAAAKSAVVDALAEKLEKVYVFPDVAKKMGDEVRARMAKKEYDSITDGKAFAEALTSHLRDVCKDGHLDVRYVESGKEFDAERPPDPEDVRRFRERGRLRNFEFKKVELLDGGAVGYLRVDGFYPADWIADTAAGAMALLANCEAVVLDLRQNHGGANGGNLLCSYFFKEETHLSDFYNRADGTTRQVWTYPLAAGEKFADKELYVLTSSHTFSAPEALAYDMQAAKRATVVGETTGGGAHPTTIYRLTAHFSASIPFARSINPVTRTDWEGTGVKPDVPVPADQALPTARLLALRKSLERHATEKDLAEGLNRAIAETEEELAALKKEAAKPG